MTNLINPLSLNTYRYCDTFWGFRGFCFRKKKIVSTQLLGFIKFRDGDLKHWGSPNRRQIPHRNISINFVVIAPLLVNGTRCTQIPVNDEKFNHQIIIKQNCKGNPKTRP